MKLETKTAERFLIEEAAVKDVPFLSGQINLIKTVMERYAMQQAVKFFEHERGISAEEMIFNYEEFLNKQIWDNAKI